jgi:hypothetical protein
MIRYVVELRAIGRKGRKQEDQQKVYAQEAKNRQQKELLEKRTEGAQRVYLAVNQLVQAQLAPAVTRCANWQHPHCNHQQWKKRKQHHNSSSIKIITASNRVGMKW